MNKRVYRDIPITSAKYLMKFAGVWLTRNRTEECQRNVSLTYMALALIFGLYVNLADIYHTWGDTTHSIYLCSNTLCILLAISKMLVIIVHREEFAQIVFIAERNFWHCNYDFQEQLLLAECRRLCVMWIMFVYVALPMTLSGYVMTPIIESFGKNQSERMLPFNMWVDWPLTATPYYELMFTFQVTCVYLAGVAYVCTDNFLCLLNMQVICQFRILQYRLINVWNAINDKMDLIEYTNHCYIQLRSCVRQHQLLIEFCNKLEDVYTMTIFGHVLICSMLMCFDCYELLLADIPLTQQIIFISHLVGTFIHVVCFTYTCHGLMEESTNITTTMYSGRWTNLPMNETGRCLRTNLRIIMLRSLRPCCLTAGGFFPVSLETSTALLSTTVSYFTLMRESSLRPDNYVG